MAVPQTCCSSFCGMPSTSPSLNTPIRVSRSSVVAPIPQTSLIGRVVRRSASSSDSITYRPSGFARREASFAISLVLPTPTLMGMPSSLATRRRSAWPASMAPAQSLAPTSRKASSIEPGSTAVALS